ncbi:esterase PIR7B-like [Oryza brachyantha]|uniref:AB hydrolase-1 domain-containing protein n=1 Tax=Oryza brachyantha TaxID=4533 RepID=J3L7K2_ORYBR|nr:esterase PIR7B-like [Oryza brachyantha]
MDGGGGGGGGKHLIHVHGLGHGAWCWYKVATMLRSGGHRVTALDLAASGAHPARVDEVGSFEEYSRPLLDAVAAAPAGERLVLVGHSFGGLSLALAMERFPDKIAAAVFVAAAMPCVGKHIGFTQELMMERSPKDLLMDSKVMPISNKQGSGTAILLGPNFLAERGYALSPAEDLTLAKSLVRPANWFLDDEMIKDAKLLTSSNYGSVKRVYLVAMEDFGVAAQRDMIALSPGTDVEEIAGADHTVMCSRPRELADLLAKISGKYD